MIGRCYSNKIQARRPSYIGCTVCTEWLNFQNFAAWYINNYYEVNGEIVALDKDLLVKKNKLYSPNTCCFLPVSINSILTGNNINRGPTPIGVSYNKHTHKYDAHCKDGKNGLRHMSESYTQEEAFAKYKAFKENILRLSAKKYARLIAPAAYQALVNYVVDIND